MLTIGFVREEITNMIRVIFNMLRNKKGPSLDGILEPMDRHLDHFKTLVRPAPESKPRTPFDGNLPKEKMSMLNTNIAQKIRFMTQAIPLFINMQKTSNLYDGKFKPVQDEASPEFIAQLERMARAAGAKDIAYVRVPNNAIFKDKGIPHQYAIVYTVEMDKEPIDTAPSFECFEEVARGYKNLAVIGNKLAGFMRGHGFAAYPGTALGGLTDYPHLAELAGLGLIGYHGLLISPHEGARLRINTIYTNITNLPIKTENEHLWVRDFCAMCKKCVRSCPADAIFEQPQARGDGGMQCIDHDACRDYFDQNFGCAVCLKVCPFSQIGYDTVRARFKGNDDAPTFRIPVKTVTHT
jgi:epoxyqueuosine reductase